MSVRLRLLLGVLISQLCHIGALRILYIVSSSSSKNNDGTDRFGNMMLRVVRESVESMMDMNYDVDLYLVLGYVLEDEQEQLLRSELPQSVGVEIWQDATPYFKQERIDRGKSTFSQDARRLLKTLSRQHRFVVRDKLFEYDMFVAFEDDMLVHGEHIRHHVSLSDTIEKLAADAPDEVDIPDGLKVLNMFHGELTKTQLAYLWPGLVRVEVLQPDSATQTVLDEIPVDTNSGLSVNASVCCGRPEALDPSADSIMIWETGIAGLRVREIPGIGWVVLLQGPAPWESGEDYVGGYFPYDDYNMSRQPLIHPHEQFLAQSGGWMATRAQILKLHLDLCYGSHLPPYDMPNFFDDGLRGFNSGVEYWSGGLQMCQRRSGCNLQRIIPLDTASFSSSLIYHTANNKQRSIKEHRRVLANNMLGQFSTLRKTAEKAKKEGRYPKNKL